MIDGVGAIGLPVRGDTMAVRRLRFNPQAVSRPRT
jgi:hypothetical protein